MTQSEAFIFFYRPERYVGKFSTCNADRTWISIQEDYHFSIMNAYPAVQEILYQ